MRLPLNRIGWVSKIQRAFIELEQLYEREPTAAEMADKLNVSVDEVLDSLRISARQVSIDSPLKSEEEGSLLDVLVDDSSEAPDGEMIRDSLRSEVRSALSTLTQRETDVVTYYFGLNNQAPMTLEEIGTIFNLTRERVRQIKEKAIRRLRYTSRSKSLKPYLG